MKTILLTLFCFLMTASLKAQKGDYEVKVVSVHMQNVKGMLQKVNKDGLAILDYRGNYFIFKAEDIVKIKVKKRGLSLMRSAGTGALAGALTAAAILSIENENISSDSYRIAAWATVIGVTAGTITGLIAEAVNVKHNLYINRSPKLFERNYKKLEQYIKVIHLEHF